MNNFSAFSLFALILALSAFASAGSSSSSSSSSSSKSLSVPSALASLMDITLDIVAKDFPERISPLDAKETRVCFKVKVDKHSSTWRKPSVRLSVGTPDSDSWVDNRGILYGGALSGNTGKPANYAGNGVLGRRTNAPFISAEAAVANGPKTFVEVEASIEKDQSAVGAGDHATFCAHIGEALTSGSAGSAAHDDVPHAHGDSLFAVRVTPYADGVALVDDRVFFTAITCSDGVFCNGQERFINGACVAAAAAACDDGSECTVDVCDEVHGECTWSVPFDAPADCLRCEGEPCEPDCEGKVCGNDGCGGSCGTCVSGLACMEGQCVVAEGDGTCAAPLAFPDGLESLVTANGYEFTLTGTTEDGANELAPSCNTISEAREKIYRFTVPEGREWGMLALVTGYDTVLEVRGATCTDQASALACADDSTPPGGLNSGISTLLPAGTYHLFVDGYSIEEFGEYQLVVRLYDNCVPTCDGALCGSNDNCGGTCGTCADGERCNDIFRCVAADCVPSCEGRECGDDGCGAECSQCPDSLFCAFDAGECVENALSLSLVEGCNPLKPVCAGGCAEGQYCSEFCECVPLDEPLVDLVVSRSVLENEHYIAERNFPASSCAVAERCVSGLGTRRLLHFSAATVNQGRIAFEPPLPEERPDLFFWSPCHAHFHFANLMTYSLLDKKNRTVVQGAKAGYCLLDATPFSEAPWVPCEAVKDCDVQGVSRGWMDIYGAELDCQWLDITGLPAGDYVLKLGVNPIRMIHESSYENNVITMPIRIDDDPEFVTTEVLDTADDSEVLNRALKSANMASAECVGRVEHAKGDHHVAKLSQELSRLWQDQLLDQCEEIDRKETAKKCVGEVKRILSAARQTISELKAFA